MSKELEELYIMGEIADKAIVYVVVDRSLEEQICGEIKEESVKRGIKVAEVDLSKESRIDWSNKKYSEWFMDGGMMKTKPRSSIFDFLKQYTPESPSITLVRRLDYFLDEAAKKVKLNPDPTLLSKEPGLSHINLTREAVSELPGVLTFVLDLETYQRVARNAQDFWAWRTDTIRIE